MLLQRHFFSIGLASMVCLFGSHSASAQCDAVTHATQEMACSPINGAAIAEIAVAKKADNYLYCFVNTAGGNIYYKRQTKLGSDQYDDIFTWNNNWNALSSSADYSCGKVVAGLGQDNVLYVASISNQGGCMVKRQTGNYTWTNWIYPQPNYQWDNRCNICVNQHQDGRFVFFAKNSNDGYLYNITHTKNGTTNRWETPGRIGSCPIGARIASIKKSNILYVFMITGSQLYVSWQQTQNTTTNWCAWYEITPRQNPWPDASADLCPVLDKDGYIRVFFIGLTNPYPIYYVRWRTYWEAPVQVVQEGMPYRKMSVLKGPYSGVLTVVYYNLDNDGSCVRVYSTYETSNGTWTTPVSIGCRGSNGGGLFHANIPVNSVGSYNTLVGGTYTLSSGMTPLRNSYFHFRPGMNFPACAIDGNTGGCIFSAWSTYSGVNGKFGGWDVIDTSSVKPVQTHPPESDCN
jgi:hypothetical protein